MSKIKTLIVILLVTICYPITSQENVPTLNPDYVITTEAYEKILSGVSPTPRKKALRARDFDIEEKEKEKKKSRSIKWPSFQGAAILQIISYLLIFLLVGFLLYFIFSKIDTNKKFKPKEVTSDAEEIEDIKDIDTATELEKALANNDYRMAIRIRFLEILQQLSIKEKINWRKEKTNRDYARELRAHPYGDNFQRLAFIFDHVWYGDQQITKEMYDEVDPEFTSFTNEVNEG